MVPLAVVAMVVVALVCHQAQAQVRDQATEAVQEADHPTEAVQEAPGLIWTL